MVRNTSDITFGIEDGGVILMGGAEEPAWLHPLWLRERCEGEGAVDPISGQRLYDPSAFDPSLITVSARRLEGDILRIAFSDGVEGDVAISKLLVETGMEMDLQSPPAPELWDSTLSPRPQADWRELNNPSILKAALDSFFKTGFCIFYNTPCEPGSLLHLAQRFGYVRETNFGMLFDVRKKKHANDIAYTNSALGAHTDNPYREPVPGIQFLHCLENSVAGGLSTLVDGFAIVNQLMREAPNEAEVLSSIPVRFRYEAAGGAIMQNIGSIIERDLNGRLKRVRLSPRLDYVPPMPRDKMDIFYAGRRRLQGYANDPAFEIRTTFEPGMLLMMDNYRTLHGRTAYEAGAGHRHLQGCYIDHDGPDSLYRMLARDGVAQVCRDVA